MKYIIQFINPTPARELINKFYYQLPNNGFLKEGLMSCDRRYKEAITCAIVCVNEILNEFPQGFNGNFEEKSVLTAFWDYGDLRISYSSTEVGEFEDADIRLSDGSKWIIPDMQTQNVTFSYGFDLANKPAKLKFSVRNFEDERAPLADGTYGYYSKVHEDTGRNYYLELRVKL